MHKMWWRKSQTFFGKAKIEYISGLTAWSFIKFLYFMSLSRTTKVYCNEGANLLLLLSIKLKVFQKNKKRSEATIMFIIF